MTQILLTGSNGFVGRYLGARLLSENYEVRKVVRQKNSSGGGQIVIADIGPSIDWKVPLTNIDVVIHLAARVHIIRDKTNDPLTAFREVNTYGTVHLAHEAATAGVRRFIYLSTVKVNGEQTIFEPGSAEPLRGIHHNSFSETNKPAPQSPYAVSKWEAEQFLQNIAAEKKMEVVIIRPPLVYGPGVKANFLRLLQIVERSIPLPLGGIDNKRSLVSLDNLVDFILCCIEHPAAAGETFFVSDGEDLSTPALIKRLAYHMNKRPYLFSVNKKLLHFGAKLVGKTEEIERLCQSLQVDIAKAKRLLGWQPPSTVDNGLAKTVKWYMKRNSA